MPCDFSVKAYSNMHASVTHASICMNLHIWIKNMRPLFQCKLQCTHSQLTNEHKLHPQPCVYNYLLSNSLRSAKGSAKKTESSCSKAMTGGVYDSVSTAFFFSLLWQTLKIRSEINVGTSLKHAKEDLPFSYLIFWLIFAVYFNIIFVIIANVFSNWQSTSTKKCHNSKIHDQLT